MESRSLIVVVLQNYDQKPLPDWPLSVTLNSFLAFFTTIAKAAFMVPVSVAISQTQWTWFLRERPLHDFQVFDQASRSPWGALVLLRRVGYRHFVILGAFLMILAIDYPVWDVVAPEGMAMAPAIRHIRSPLDRLDKSSDRGILMATVSDDTGYKTPIPPIAPFCSTGNCTFDRYYTLGVCLKMVNITSLLQTEEFDGLEQLDVPIKGSVFPGDKVWKASLPGNHALAHQTSMAMSTILLNGSDTFAFKDDAALSQARVASFALIHTSPVVENYTWWDQATTPSVEDMLAAIGGFQYEAWEMLYYLCVQSYDTKVTMNVPTTQLVDSWAEPVDENSGFFLDTACLSILHDNFITCYSNSSRWNETLHLKSPIRGPLEEDGSPFGDKGEFTANYRAMELMADEMARGMQGYITTPYDSPEKTDAYIAVTGREFAQNLFPIVFRQDTILDHSLRHTLVSNLFTNVATSLSSHMRASKPRKYTQYAFNVTGQAWKQASHVRITWGWISFLAVEILVAAVFLVLTIASQALTESRNGTSEGDQIAFRDVKDSSLATLVALSDDCRVAAGGGLRSAQNLVSTAKELQVRLEGDEIVRVKQDPVEFRY
ncbi:hypothetical protein ColTof4_13622 [Colletotrichum tofieldiae]|nr:hypothetical protein ColTof3_14577 [Colletotrichum tofieldiae]GKT81199.1 hypothetical protein ColTof4_13622 [Colletotrichum tofieldiae]